MHTKTSLLTATSLALLCFASSPTWAEDARAELFTALDGAKSTKDLPAIAKKLERKYDAATIIRLLRKGRPNLPAFKKSEGTVTLVDKLGRSTDLHYVIPSKPAPKGGYGVLLALHGLNAPPRQLFNLYRKTANDQGWILLAPHARRLPFGGSKGPSGRSAEANEDTMGVEPLNQWYAYRSYGLPMAALSKIKRHYPINTNKILLSGFSMGGYATWNLGLRYPDRFAALAPLSGSISRQEKFGLADRRSRFLVDNAQRIPLFFVHGAQDRMVPPNSDRFCRDRLKELGANFIYQESPSSAHGLRDWFRDADKPKTLNKWLTKQKRNAAPKTVEHRSIGAYMNRSFWLEITDSKGKRASIKAEVQPNNVIEVECKDVTAFRVSLDPRLVQLNKAVTVVCNGQRLFQGKVQPSILNVARSWHDREDSQLLYSHSIDCVVGAKARPKTQAKARPKAQSTPRAKLY